MTYFDTPDNLLDRAELTLRVRRSGDTRIQTVKSHANERGVAANRWEWEWRISQDEPALGRLGKIRALTMAATDPVIVAKWRQEISGVRGMFC